MNTIFLSNLLDGKTGRGQIFIHHFFNGFDGNGITMSHTFGNLVGNVDLILTLKHSWNKGHARSNILLVFFGKIPLGSFFDIVVSLEIAGFRQKDVGPHGNIGGHNINTHDKVHLLKDFLHFFLTWNGLHGVLTPDNTTLDRVRFTADGTVTN